MADGWVGDGASGDGRSRRLRGVPAVRAAASPWPMLTTVQPLGGAESDEVAQDAAHDGAGEQSGEPSDPSDPQPEPAAFRVRCPDCGPQHVAISDLRFVETESDPSDPGDTGSANRYVFACPACGTRVRRPAGPELSEILRSSGVATLSLHRGPGPT